MRRVLFLVGCLLAAALGGWAETQITLVTPAWVAQHATDPNVRILDVRLDVHEYFIGHVPNAVHMADSTVRGPQLGFPVQYLPINMLRDLMMRAGVRDGQTVVIYSDGDNTPGATMVAYVLNKLGYPQVAFMNGGWSAYKAANLPVAQQYPSYQPGPLTVRENRTIGADLAMVRAALTNPNVKFIDARPPEAYAGDVNTWQRNGHIPGAINIPWPSIMDPNNKHQYKPLADIQAIYDAKGITKTDTIILYCGTSREASVEFVMLRHVLGYPNVRLFEGSWNMYSAIPDLPVVKGPQPR